ncbi:MAG: sulfatase-like hydrolase/transferase, partial [Phycisphaerales bacterium]
MRGRKGSEYDGGHRVPFFVRWPGGGLGGGRDVGRLTAHVDVLPTLVELCGLKKPESVKLDGSSLAGLLSGKGGQWPERTLVVHSQRIEHPEKWRKSAVMTERWRLVNGKELYEIKADPEQKRDVAAEEARVVKRLRGEYERWWESISERFEGYCEIVIGSERENPTRLMSHDWHSRNPAWSQRSVLSGAKSNGFWAVEVEREGAYEFSLRRWPVEADAAIDAAIRGGKAIRATRARIRVADVDMSKVVGEGAKEVTFRARLKAGKTRLQSWFIDEKGESRGAYYVYVRRLQ